MSFPQKGLLGRLIERRLGYRVARLPFFSSLLRSLRLSSAACEPLRSRFSGSASRLPSRESTRERSVPRPLIAFWRSSCSRSNSRCSRSCILVNVSRPASRSRRRSLSAFALVALLPPPDGPVRSVDICFLLVSLSLMYASSLPVPCALVFPGRCSWSFRDAPVLSASLLEVRSRSLVPGVPLTKSRLPVPQPFSSITAVDPSLVACSGGFDRASARTSARISRLSESRGSFEEGGSDELDVPSLPQAAPSSLSRFRSFPLVRRLMASCGRSEAVANCRLPVLSEGADEPSVGPQSPSGNGEHGA